jgi:multiple sugar transport system substrate-binding protein
MKKFAMMLSAMALLVTACGGNDNETGGSAENNESGNNADATQEKQTLEVALWSDAVEDALEVSIAEFEEANPNVDVRVTITPFGDYWTRMRTSLGGGSGPDVFWMNGPNLYQYVNNGLIENLQPYIEDTESFNVDDYYETVVDLYTHEGDLYAAPYFLDSVALFYNKDIFDEAGVDYPNENWTWEDIEQHGLELTNPEEGTFGYAAYTAISQEGYYNIIHQAGGEIISEDRTSSGFDKPETKEAFHFLDSLIEQGISPNTQSQIETVPRDLFLSGRMAMLPAVSTNSALLLEGLGDSLGVTHLPQGKERASIVHGIGWAMNPNTNDKDLAFDLIESLTNEDGNRAIAESGYSIPAYMDMSETWVESLPSLDLQVFIDAQEYGVVYPISENTSEWQSVETEEIQNAFLQDQSIDDALDRIAEKMNEILAEENN